MSKLFKRIGAHKLLPVIIILQVMFMVILGGFYKNGLYLDEYYSYGLSNSYYNPFFYLNNDWMDNWHSRSEFVEYLTVQPSETFSFDSVYFNQSQDVHPPVYYLLLHTLCSFFPNQFTKWFGLSLNIFLFVIGQIVIYFISKRLAGKKVGIAACMLFGFSLGAANIVLFIRMYMLLTVEVLIYFYIHTLLFGKTLDISNEISLINRRNVVDYILLFLTVYIGALTHYYFLVYAFYIALFFLLLKLVMKKYKGIISYCGTQLTALIFAYFSFPYMKDHILHGDRGRGAIDNAFSVGNWINRIVSYFQVLIRQQLGNMFFLLLLLIIVVLILICLNNRNLTKNNLSKDGNQISDEKKRGLLFADLRITILFIASVLYCMTTGIVSPFVEGRYIYASYPVFVLVIVLFINNLISYIKKNCAVDSKVGEFFGSNKLYITIICLSIIFLGCNWIGNEEIQFSYPSYSLLEEKFKDVGDKELVYITDGSYEAVAELGDFVMFKEVYPISMRNINNLDKFIDNSKNDNPIYVFFNIGYDSDTSREEFINDTEYTSYELIYVNEGYDYTYGSLYKFYK